MFAADYEVFYIFSLKQMLRKYPNRRNDDFFQGSMHHTIAKIHRNEGTEELWQILPLSGIRHH